jgi:hypothetical protein
VALALVLAAGLPALAAAHGGEDLSEQPARALVQQALGLVTQQGDSGEALERLEAAQESEDTENVDLASVRAAAEALEAGDTAAAVELMNDALTAEQREKKEEDESGGVAVEEDEHAAGEEDEHAAGEVPEPTEGALEDHANAVDPDRGSAEWIGLAVGIVLIGGGGAALGLRRKDS